QKERIEKLAAKSHKEKVDEYNKYLSSLSEHHDIPRVRFFFSSSTIQCIYLRTFWFWQVGPG
ncbi:hypothetical protein BC828DRAFT_349275, partial [Blastocladiella britannica]